jgi:uncharacterized protein (UPF0248 family)
MQPLHDLLARIRWDAEFSKGVFALGVYDRVARQELIVPFASVSFDTERPGMFRVEDEEGFFRQIPLHRVRTVYKDGVVIWQRPIPPEGD